jgi:hypothetical protein
VTSEFQTLNMMITVETQVESVGSTDLSELGCGRHGGKRCGEGEDKLSADLPRVRQCIHGNYAHRCMHLLFRMPALSGDVASEKGTLLRVLFLRFGCLSTGSNERLLLCAAGRMTPSPQRSHEETRTPHWGD